MSADRFRSHPTRKEAQAFIAGVRFVNDSAIEVLGLFKIPAKGKQKAGTAFVVWLADYDKPDSESDSRPTGWRNRVELD